MTAPIRATTRASSYKKKTMLCSLDAIFISFFFDRTRPRDRNSIISLYFLPLSEPFTLTNTLRKFFELVAACFFLYMRVPNRLERHQANQHEKTKKGGLFPNVQKKQEPNPIRNVSEGEKNCVIRKIKRTTQWLFGILENKAKMGRKVKWLYRVN